MASDLAIRIRGVNKRFGPTRAVCDLDLDVPTGTVCGFLGPNGAGKTTTIRMIMSIMYPDSGEIDVLGSSALANKDRIGYLPEERGLYRRMRVLEFLEYIARLKGDGRPDLRGRARAWLERIDLANVERKRCQELSKGMQQKVQFLAAIIHDPDLVILDEPFSGLDPVNAQLLNRIIEDLHAKGRTIVFSTHVLHQAEQICDRIFLIHKGVKLLDRPLSEIHEQFNPRAILARPLGAVEIPPSLPGVLAARRLPDGAFELEMGADADPTMIMREVLDLGPMRSVELRRLSLDEVFIEVVQREEGEAAAREVREELSHV
jgi:ABC-2 type transport system ATP-binding protein